MEKETILMDENGQPLEGAKKREKSDQARAEMPIFVRTFDFLQWILQVSNHLPRAYRHSFTQRLLEAAFDMRERLEEANARKEQARMERLERANEALLKVRLYLRLAARLNWLTGGQYQHGASMLVEIGKLLGGWMKVTKPALTQAA